MTNEEKAREIAQVIHDRIREQGFVTTWPWDAGVGRIMAALAEKDAEIERLKSAIREHRDQLGDDRCWEDDERLYAVLGKGDGEAETALPSKGEFLKSCERFWEQRQCPAVKGHFQVRTIAQLEAEIEQLRDGVGRLMQQCDGQLGVEFARLLVGAYQMRGPA